MLPYPLRQLAQACTAAPLAPKFLLVPRRRVGHGLTHALARHGVTWTQLHVTTVADLAHDRVQIDMALKGGRRLTGDGAWLLAHDILTSHPEAAFTCYGPIRSATATALWRTLRDLRLGGCSARQLRATGASHLAELLGAYEDHLQRQGWWDEAAILESATQRAAEPPTEPREAAYLILDETELSTRESSFVEAVARGRLQRIGRVDYGAATPAAWAHRRLPQAPLAEEVPIPAHPPHPPTRSTGADEGVQGDLFLDHLLSPEPSPEPPATFPADVDTQPGGRLLTTGLTAVDADCIHLWQATGHESEIRGVLRDILDRQLAFDDVEIVYPTSHGTYLPLLSDMICRFDLPAAFSGGIPVQETRTGRSLQAFLDWIASGLDGRHLVQSLRAGDIDWSLETVDVTQVSAWLLQGRVGDGRRAAEEALNRVFLHQAPEHGEEVRRALARLGDHVPAAAQIDLPTLARHAITYLSQWAQICAEATVLDAVCRRLRRIAAGTSVAMQREVAAQTLRERLLSDTVGARLPGPGQLAISRLDDAGYSGRGHVYILGMAESHFPTASVPDPALDDAQRSAGSLPRSSERSEADTVHLIRVLGGAAAVTLIAHRLTLADGREPYPTPLYCRAQQDLKIRPVWQRPTTTTSVGIDDLERLLPLRRRQAFGQMLQEAYPAVHQGFQAHRARGQGVTRFDGWIGADKHPLSLPRSYSARMLETLAECPRRWLWQDALGLRIGDEPTRDPRRWLQPVELGNLLHGLFLEFIGQIHARGQTPSPAHHELLAALVEAAIEQTATTIPPTLTAAFRNDRRRIEAAARVFLEAEIDRFNETDGLELFDFEWEFGDQGRPVLVRIGTWELPLRGRIDRIDRVRRSEGEYEYEIWDYKTGSTFGFEPGQLLGGGRRLQWALYGAALAAHLTEKALVHLSGYFFTSDRGAGQRFAAPPPTSQELGHVLSPLLELAEEGLFPAIHKGGAAFPCRFCDYRRICASEAHDDRGLAPRAETMSQWSGLMEGWAQTKTSGRRQASHVIESRLSQAGIQIEDIGPADAIDKMRAWMAS